MILNEIAAKTRERMIEQQRRHPLAEVRAKAEVLAAAERTAQAARTAGLLAAHRAGGGVTPAKALPNEGRGDVSSPTGDGAPSGVPRGTPEQRTGDRPSHDADTESLAGSSVGPVPRCSDAQGQGRSTALTGGEDVSGQPPGAAGALLPFERALAAERISFICEVKRASPSKGLIAPDFPYLEIARSYEEAGASAISCLTEPFYFQGRDRYLSEIAAAVSLPVLRKDFTVDPYMIYEAKALGAAAVLLICAILDDAELAAYLELARELGLSALVEAHTEHEVERALKSGARVIGVNNRDLQTFQVDITTSVRLRKLVPPDRLYVSESGIVTPADVAALRQNGTDAVLIGETLMRSPDRRAALAALRGAEE